MNWTDDVVGLRVFEKMVSLGSMTAAASELGMSLAAASKRLAKFEERAGVQLIHRSTRQMSVSEEGMMLYQYARKILDEMHRAQEAMLEKQERVAGTIRMTAPKSFGQRRLLPIFTEFCQRYPQLKFELDFSDEVKDLLGDDLDLAIRYGVLPDSRLIARQLLPNRRVLCASPSYLEQYGELHSLKELAAHRCITMGISADTFWQFDHDRIAVHGHFLCSDGEISHQLALQGLGIALKSYWDVAEDLLQGRLVQILPQVATASAPISVIYPKHREQSPRMRLFIDYLLEKMEELQQTVLKDLEQKQGQTES